MLKKSIFLAVFLALVAFPTIPTPVNAQAFSAEQQASLDSIRETLIELLTQQIALLQAQIADLLERQEETNERIETVSRQSEPTLGVVEVEEELTASVSFDVPTTNERINYIATGTWDNARISVTREDGALIQQQWINNGESDHIDNWTPNSTYSWTLEFGNGTSKEVLANPETISGSFTTPSL